MFEQAFSEDHPDLARSRRVLARLLLAHGGDVDEAARLLEASWKVLGSDETSVQDRAGTAFDLARALWHDRAQRPRARELARLAADAWANDARGSEDAARVDAWIRSHR